VGRAQDFGDCVGDFSEAEFSERAFASLVDESPEAADLTSWLSSVFSDLDGEGYAIGWSCLPAGGFGAPHIRYRIFFVAHAADKRHEWAGGARRRRDGFADDGALGGLADAYGAGSGRQRSAGLPGDGDAPYRNNADRRGEAGWPGSPDGFWSDADWIFCRDGKWRPIEPGSFPLVDGSAFSLGLGGPYEGMSRAGMLRGYGNAIVLPVARAFVEAAIEAIFHPGNSG
jgi:DNA (cytosine-5)-methyltransferase 1